MNHHDFSKDASIDETAFLVIRATRSWVHAILENACNTARGRHLRIWDETFDLIGSRDAAQVWSNFMRLLSLEGNTKFRLGCGNCGLESDDEKALLQCLAAHQKGRKSEALAILGQWFSGDCLWRADTIVEAFTDRLTLKGLQVPYGPAAASIYELSNIHKVSAHLIN